MLAAVAMALSLTTFDSAAAPSRDALTQPRASVEQSAEIVAQKRARSSDFHIDDSLGEPDPTGRRERGLDGMSGGAVGTYTGRGLGSYTGGGLGSYTGGGLGNLGGATAPAPTLNGRPAPNVR
jgi:hypothetical protein